MQVLFFDASNLTVAPLRDGMEDLGHEVRVFSEVDGAMDFGRVNVPDLLIAVLAPGTDFEKLSGSLSIVFTCQFHNPRLSTILLTESGLFELGELFGMLSSLRCVLGRQTPAADILAIAQHYLSHDPDSCERTPEAAAVCAVCSVCRLQVRCKCRVANTGFPIDRGVARVA